jgi:hypothetical protein
MGGADETEHIKVRKANPGNRYEYVSDVMEIDAYTKFVFPGARPGIQNLNGTIITLQELTMRII